MAIEIKSHTKINDFPAFGIFMGAPKAGKSTFMSTIPNSLILNLEPRGYDNITCDAMAKIRDRDELKEGIAEFLKGDYEHLIIDHLREVVNYFSVDIAAEHKVKMIDEIGWQYGHKELRVDISNFFRTIIKSASYKKRIFLVAHTSDKKGNVKLDVDGDNESMILGLVDFVGYLYRQGPTLNINMCSKTGAEYGVRNDKLSTYDDVADYGKLLEIARS